MEDYCGIVHLDSNAIDSRTKNTPSSFVNFTPCLFTYSSKNFEVALTELQYQHSWYNLPTIQYVGFFEKPLKIPQFIRSIDAGYYQSIEDLLKIINDLIYWSCRNSREEDPKVKAANEKIKEGVLYYDNTRKMKIKRPDLLDYEIGFSYELAQVLGYTNHFFMVYTLSDYEQLAKQEEFRIRSMYPSVNMVAVAETPYHGAEGKKDPMPGGSNLVVMKYEARFPKTSVAERPFDVSGGIDQLFVYCNLIKEHMFGNQSKKILRVISINRSEFDRFGQNITTAILNPQFFPLFETVFDRVEIEIRDRCGQLIPFTSGSVIATIEIRRKEDGRLLF